MNSKAQSTGEVSRCPNCGGPIRFGGAHSLAAVCSYCRSAVARRGVDVELIGKIPDLVATDTRLSLGRSGRVGSASYTVLGHVQLSRVGAEGEPDDAAWDEWYCGFSDGTWGWLAEAQGRLYLTRPVDGRTPSFPFEGLYAGQRINEPGIGVLAVEEVGTSRFVAAEGELPFVPSIGGTYRFADLSAGDGRFVTFDYGSDEDGQGDAQIFSGRRLGYDEAGLADAAPPMREARGEAEALACPNCGASLSLKNPETVSVSCPSCRSLLDRSERAVKILSKAASRENPPIPLGSRGELDGEACEVLGWMRRSVTVDGTTYPWDEYLLHGKSGYRWLSEGNGHFHLVTPLDAGRVHPQAGQMAIVGDRTFKHFQGGEARYESIQGEFYWRVSTKKPVYTNDYIDPPYMLSSENDRTEETWSMGRYVEADEVWRAFRLEGKPPAQKGVGAAQGNPWGAVFKGALKVAALAFVAQIVSCVVLAGALPQEKVLSVDVPLTPTIPQPPPPDPDGSFGPAPPPAPPGPEALVFVSEPFEIKGNRQAVEIEAAAECEQSWIGLDVALINDDTGDSTAGGIELSYYHGVDDGEAWSEGSKGGSVTFGSIKRGRYVLRAEPQFGRDASGSLPLSVHVNVIRGPLRFGSSFVILLVIFAWPIVLLFRRRGFEKRRWADSDHPLDGGGGGGSDDSSSDDSDSSWSSDD